MFKCKLLSWACFHSDTVDFSRNGFGFIFPCCLNGETVTIVLRIDHILYSNPTSFAVVACVTRHTRAAVGIEFVVARGSILTRITRTFVDVYND